MTSKEIYVVARALMDDKGMLVLQSLESAWQTEKEAHVSKQRKEMLYRGRGKLAMAQEILRLEVVFVVIPVRMIEAGAE